MKRIGLAVASGAAAMLLAGGANAATLAYSQTFDAAPGAEWNLTEIGSYSQTAGVLGEAAGCCNGSGYSRAVLTQVASDPSASALNGTLTFDFLGFRSLDAYGFYTDELVLKVNGDTVFSGAFNLGGGGFESFSSSTGATVTDIGGARRISVAFTGIAGANTFDFRVGPGMEGLGNEAWGLDNVSLSAELAPPPTGGVPEPATWAMMILGFGAAGSVARRRRSASATA